ncbi:MAG: hypothetical protein RLY31_1073 [Bacteroidota bacterium]
MKRIFTLLTVASLYLPSLVAQSDPMFTFNLFNQLQTNPAVAGSAEVLDAGAIYRNQWWSGIDGAPRTTNLFVHHPFARQRRMGIGMNMLYDRIGTDKIFSLALDYAYRIRLPKQYVLSLGLMGLVENARTDWGEANAAVNAVDARIGQDVGSRTVLNIGPGVYLKNRHWYAGMSVPRLLPNALYSDADAYGLEVNTFFFQTGATWRMPGHPQVEWLPNLQVRLNPSAPFSYSANLNVRFHQALLLGVAMHRKDSVDGLLMYHFKSGLKLGAALDFTTSDLRQATTGSYEVLVGYTFPCEDCKVKSLRYF